MPSKKTIAVDIDEVLVETAPKIIEFYNSKYGTNVQLKDYYGDGTTAWGVDSIKEAINRVNSYIDTPEYMSLKPVQKSIEVMESLSDKYKLYAITGRPDFIATATNIWLAEHFPELFHEIVFTNFYDPDRKRAKGDVCVELGVELLIDDHPGHILSASEKGIDGLLFGNFPWTADIGELPDNVRKVNDWDEVAAILL